MPRGKACPKKEHLEQSRAMRGIEWLESGGVEQVPSGKGFVSIAPLYTDIMRIRSRDVAVWR